MNRENSFDKANMVPEIAGVASVQESQGKGLSDYVCGYSSYEAFGEFEDRLDGIDEGATREKVCTLLNERGLTDRVLSERIGISRQAVNKWRHKKNFVDIENLYILSGILRMKVDDLLVPRRRSQERAVLIETNGNIEDSDNQRIKRLEQYYTLIMDVMRKEKPMDVPPASRILLVPEVNTI